MIEMVKKTNYLFMLLSCLGSLRENFTLTPNNFSIHCFLNFKKLILNFRLGIYWYNGHDKHYFFSTYKHSFHILAVLLYTKPYMFITGVDITLEKCFSKCLNWLSIDIVRKHEVADKKNTILIIW